MNFRHSTSNIYLDTAHNLYILVNIRIEHQFGDWYGPQSIVIDNGSGIVKTEFAGEDHPCAIFHPLSQILATQAI